MNIDLKGRDFLKLLDYSKEEIIYLLGLAKALKEKKKNHENHAYLKGKNVYITFDIDFLNPAIAPATNCPEPGGPSYYETLKYLKEVISSSKKIIGVDFVEYNPTCEGSVLTGTTIVNLIMETLSYMTKYNTTS